MEFSPLSFRGGYARGTVAQLRQLHVRNQGSREFSKLFPRHEAFAFALKQLLNRIGTLAHRQIFFPPPGHAVASIHGERSN